MKYFNHQDLAPFAMAILQANGVPDNVAETVVRHAISSLLSGEDNHGIELGTEYLEAVRAGLLQPNATPQILNETDTTILVDGGFNFGHYVSEWTMDRLLEKAALSHVAVASIRNQGHVGRLIDYTARAAERGFVGMMMTDGAFGRRSVAPFGGTERRLGVNPFSIVVPSDLEGTVGFDMTSGAVSKGKIRRAQRDGQQIPFDWLVDRDGRQSTDPNDFYDGGSVLPLGGANLAYKGYALIFMIEILADILAGMEFREDPERLEYKSDPTRPKLVIDGCFMFVVDVSVFRPLDEFKSDVRSLTEYVKSSALVEGSTGIFYPGERSAITKAERSSNGVGIPDDCWERILSYAREANLEGAIPLMLP